MVLFLYKGIELSIFTQISGELYFIIIIIKKNVSQRKKTICQICMQSVPKISFPIFKKIFKQSQSKIFLCIATLSAPPHHLP